MNIEVSILNRVYKSKILIDTLHTLYNKVLVMYFKKFYFEINVILRECIIFLLYIYIYIYIY